jgi:ATP-dependent Clp protease ATP-binding subunit ClpC
MDDRFDRFDEQAKRVLSFAQEEAMRFKHTFIGAEHLLLGLIRVPECTACQVLMQMNVDLQVMHQIVERTMRYGDKNLAGNICLAPRGKRVMELAVDEARLMQHHIIGTEHILLGIIREGEDDVTEDDVTNVFSRLSIDLLDARAHTLKILTFQKNDADELIASKNLIFVYPPVAAQASSLVPKGMPFLICSRCQARCPDYFHYCFHCGQHFASIE